MKFNKYVLCLLLLLIFSVGSIYAAMAVPSTGTKKLDLSKYHNVGNIWLRVSNYGFFGSGDDVVPQYPSLEYPGGSGIDYLYQGALWFGAKKYRRDDANRKLYWLANNPSADSTGYTFEGSPLWHPGLKPVIDTLTTVGFDGDKDLYEFLPAYNPLVVGNANWVDEYNLYNAVDQIMTASSRTQKRGDDDDGDGKIDEDGPGYTFPLRAPAELPTVFAPLGGAYLHENDNYNLIMNGSNAEIWFPLGFMDLSDRTFLTYSYSNPYDDDGDGLIDEDGFPVSEQDFISYYYDYDPFGGVKRDRDFGGSRSTNSHEHLNVRVRQMSYQWSYDYIKNMVYVEFNITNMNIATQDTLFDCAMGIYMDADCGPQSMGPEKAADDVSGYVKGSGYEFAYTRDQDGDNGLTTGFVGARVCTPDPEELRFHCWYWKVGDGPDDFNPLSFNYSPRKTANEKYWLLTGRNPNDDKFDALRPEQAGQTHFEQLSANDTRFLFSFYGAQPGTPEYDEMEGGHYKYRWNLPPGKTMKIVVAVFPGQDLEDLKKSAEWAKIIYGDAQVLDTVTQPDIFRHYDPPEPPEIPKLHAELVDNGNRIDLFWDNRSEFAYDVKTVSAGSMGWQDNPALSHLDSYADPALVASGFAGIPEEFRPLVDELGNYIYNYNAVVNPITANRLRHDFQGYTMWGRSGTGSQEDWEMISRWDKIDTAQDHMDYTVNSGTPQFADFGGYLGIDTDLPNKNAWNNPSQYGQFYEQSDTYELVPVTGDFYGFPLYDPAVDYSAALVAQAQQIATDNPGLDLESIKNLQARLFKHPDCPVSIYDELKDGKLLPLPGLGGQVAIGNPASLERLMKNRLARRYYQASINYPRKGVEYYTALTAYDRGIPIRLLNFLETGRDSDANMKVFFPGGTATNNMDNIYVVPNPYIGKSQFDGRRANDTNGDRSRRLWFANLPERCDIRIYTLAGDLVDQIEHNGAYTEDIITVSKAAALGISASGIHAWDLLSRNNQIIAPGVYLYSVENRANNERKVGKFVIIK